MENKSKTPLSKFPTEALLYLYRKNRHCWTRAPWTSYNFRNLRTGEVEHWVPVIGKFEEDGKIYNPAIIAYERISAKEFHKRYTEVKGNRIEWDHTTLFCYFGDIIHISFEGMTWEGNVSEIQNELNTRPHIGPMTAKQFRVWKMNYKRQLNNK